MYLFCRYLKRREDIHALEKHISSQQHDNSGSRSPPGKTSNRMASEQNNGSQYGPPAESPRRSSLVPPPTAESTPYEMFMSAAGSPRKKLNRVECEQLQLHQQQFSSPQNQERECAVDIEAPSHQHQQLNSEKSSASLSYSISMHSTQLTAVPRATAAGAALYDNNDGDETVAACGNSEQRGVELKQTLLRPAE